MALLRTLKGFIKQCDVLTMRAINRKHKSKRRPRSGGARFNSNPWAQVQAKDPCVYCGGVVETLDHIRPISLGQQRIQPLIGGFGANDWPNRAPCCARCNQLKATKGLLQFLVEQTNHDRCKHAD